MWSPYIDDGTHECLITHRNARMHYTYLKPTILELQINNIQLKAQLLDSGSGLTVISEKNILRII